MTASHTELAEAIARGCGWETYIGVDKVRFWIVGQTALTATGIADLNLLLIAPDGPYQKVLRPKGWRIIDLWDAWEDGQCDFALGREEHKAITARDPNLLVAVASAIRDALEASK